MLQSTNWRKYLLMFGLGFGFGLFALYSIIQLKWRDPSRPDTSLNHAYNHHIEHNDRSENVIHNGNPEAYAVVLPYTGSSNGTVLIAEKYEVMTRVRANEIGSVTSTNYKNVVPPNYLHSFKSPCWLQKCSTPNGLPEMRCLPFFYMVGFPKCASTDIYYTIVSHPHVLLPRKKELYFWGNNRGLETYYQNDLQPAVARLHLKCTAGYHCPYIFGDGTVSYIHQNKEKVLAPILHFTPNAKMIVTVRDPVERLYSNYLHFVKNTSPDNFHRGVEECLPKWRQCHSSHTTEYCANTLRSGCKQIDVWGCMYKVHIKRWMDDTGPQHFYVIQYEHWKSNRTAELKSIFDFLELAPLSDAFFAMVFAKGKQNTKESHPGRDLRPMRNDTRRKLEEFFQPFNKELATFLNDTKWTYNERS